MHIWWFQWRSTSEISMVSAAGEGIQVQVPSIWPGICAHYAHKVSPSCGSFLSTAGSVVVYLDDILLMAGTQELLLIHLQLTMSLSTNLGFMLNIKKCDRIPCRWLEFLGFIVDSLAFPLYDSPDKIVKIKKECQHLLNKDKVSWKDIGSHYWPFVISHTSGTAGSSALSRSTVFEVNSFAAVWSTKPRLGCHSAPHPGGSTRFDVVEYSFQEGWPIWCPQPGLARCIIERLGSPFNSHATDNLGNLEPRRIGTPHTM